MKHVIWAKIKQSLHKNELVGTRFMASKPNEVAQDHNHGILCSNALKFGTWVHHAMPMNVYIASS